MSLRTAGTAYFHYLTGSKEHHWWDWPALLLLGGASWIYRKAVIMKYRSFADHEERQERLPAVVISLGNITVGGTGKTPMACMLAKELSARGWRVALLNRGYHSKREKGGARSCPMAAWYSLRLKRGAMKRVSWPEASWVFPSSSVGTEL